MPIRVNNGMRDEEIGLMGPAHDEAHNTLQSEY